MERAFVLFLELKSFYTLQLQWYLDASTGITSSPGTEKQQATKQPRKRERSQKLETFRRQTKVTHRGLATGKLQRRSRGLDAAKDGADPSHQHQRSQATQDRD